MIDPTDFRDEIIRPTLMYLGGRFNSPAAVALLLGTALVESRLTYLRQIGGGPALGVYQIEPATLRDVYKNYLDNRPELAEEIRNRWGYQGMNLAEQLKGDLFYATVIARLIYYRAPGALPRADDLRGLADYWKQYYNTEQGKGDPAEFVRLYKQHLGG